MAVQFFSIWKKAFVMTYVKHFLITYLEGRHFLMIKFWVFEQMTIALTFNWNQCNHSVFDGSFSLWWVIFYYFSASLCQLSFPICGKLNIYYTIFKLLIVACFSYASVEMTFLSEKKYHNQSFLIVLQDRLCWNRKLLQMRNYKVLKKNTTGMLLMVCWLNNYLWWLKLHNYYIT